MEDGSDGRAGSVPRALIRAVRCYHRHQVVVDAPLPDEPALLVSNHGFGALTDSHVLALAATLEAIAPDRRVTILVHDLAWRMRLGPLLEPLGGARASGEAAAAAWEQGRDVAVFPGGDLDAGKSWVDRDKVSFHGRSGFARLAMTHGVPIVPVVTAGGGESAFVLTDGQRLASLLGVDRLLRLHALPVSVSVPWGLSLGLVGYVPFLPLPTKLVTAVLPRMRASRDESPAELAVRVESAMQARVDELVQGRRPVLG